MYVHVYADLVTLSKSSDLGKSVMDMNQHYLELQSYLQEVEQYPEIVLDQERQVFPSEQRLYKPDEKTNHRHKNKHIYTQLFGLDNASVLYPVLVSGVSKMREKLCNYAGKQLPGGDYWEPDSPVRKILSKLQPSNDLCESLLGLNDYLTGAIQNLSQDAKSNLVAVRKNHTMEWLNKLPQEDQMKVVNLAIKERPKIVNNRKMVKEEQCKHRQQSLHQAHFRREVLKEKLQKERDELSKYHLITSSEELHQQLLKIDNERISTAKKKSQKVSLLKTQVRIRKKILKQNTHIVFTCGGKQRPVHNVAQELCKFLDKDSSSHHAYIEHPESLVGKDIHHRFEIEGLNESQWFNGRVISFNPVSKTHEIEYEGEEEHCTFDLGVDLLSGDLKVL